MKINFTGFSFQYIIFGNYFQEQFGQFVNLDHLPDKNDFDHFDTDGNGILFLEEWEAAQ